MQLLRIVMTEKVSSTSFHYIITYKSSLKLNFSLCPHSYLCIVPKCISTFRCITVEISHVNWLIIKNVNWDGSTLMVLLMNTCLHVLCWQIILRQQPMPHRIHNMFSFVLAHHCYILHQASQAERHA